MVLISENKNLNSHADNYVHHYSIFMDDMSLLDVDSQQVTCRACLCK